MVARQPWVFGADKLPQQLQLSDTLAGFGTQVVDTSVSSGDFSQNGSYIKVLEAVFTATGTKAKLTGALTVNHGSAATTPFYAYCELYDTTAGATVGSGKAMAMNLNSGSIAQGSVSPVYGAAGLMVGHQYACRLWVQRASANGSSPYTAELVGANL